MRYDNIAMRIVKLLYPLAIYLLIGMVVLEAFPGQRLYGLLAEKLLTAGVMAWIFWKDGREILWKHSVDWIPAVLVSVFFGMMACIGLNYLLLVTGITRLLSDSYHVVTENLYSGAIWMELAVTALAAPLAEELLFRGVCFRRMRTWCSFLPAALVTSLLFALFHGNAIQAIYGFFMGMAFSYIYERTGKILFPVLAHMAANLISVLVSEIPFLTELLNEHPLITAGIGLAVSISCLPALRRCTEVEEVS